MKRAKIRKILYNGEDRWLVTWYDLQDARREKRFPNKRHADEYATRVDKERAENIHVADRATITFGKACQAWLKQCEQRYNSKNRTLAGNTYHSYLDITKNHVMPRMARMKLSNRHIHREVQAWINELAEKYAVGGVPFHALNVVLLVLKFAVEQDLLPRNPLKDKKIKLPGARHSRGGDEIPTFDEIKKLLAHLHGRKPDGHKKLDWAQKIALVSLATFGGLRSGECCALRWEHVDLGAREINVKKSLSRYDGEKDPKTKSSVRTVPMNPILHNVLKNYAQFIGNRTGLIFRTQSGEKPYPNWVEVHMSQAMRSAGVIDPTGAKDWRGLPRAKFTFHLLRHFAGSAWLAQGMKIQDVSWLLGHKNIHVTMSIYAHQLKGDDHARQVLNTQIVKFPGIPHSGSVTTEPPPPVIVAFNEEPKLITDSSSPAGKIYEPIPVPEAPGLEAVPTITIPPEAPHYVGYVVRLLQSGWEVRDVAKEVGLSRARLFQVFHDLGLQSPGLVAMKAREARVEYLRDHGYTLKEAGRIVGVTLGHVHRIEKRLQANGRELRPRPRAGRPRNPIPSQVIENKAETAILPSQNAGNMREDQLKLL